MLGLARRPVGELSTGTRRMVELAASLALDPTVLLLDEPAGGIAQSEGDVLVDLFSGVRRELGTTLVVIEHDLPLLFRLADRLVAMELGAEIAQMVVYLGTAWIVGVGVWRTFKGARPQT